LMIQAVLLQSLTGTCSKSHKVGYPKLRHDWPYPSRCPCISSNSLAKKISLASSDINIAAAPPSETWEQWVCWTKGLGQQNSSHIGHQLEKIEKTSVYILPLVWETNLCSLWCLLHIWQAMLVNAKLLVSPSDIRCGSTQKLCSEP
jgi:hypothetical protein